METELYTVYTNEELEENNYDPGLIEAHKKNMRENTKMETQENNQSDLKIGIGNEEAVTLQPKDVTIFNVEIQEVGEKKSKKLVCTAKHPDKEEMIQISSLKYETKGKLEVSGLWVNKDSKGLIRKGCALAVFLQKNSCNVIEELVNKKVPTMLDEKGYLCFKGY